MSLPIFVIGMEQHRQRYEKTMALFAAQGLKASLWPGLDLKKQGLEEGERICRSCALLLKQGLRITQGAAGCYFAHVRLMKHLLAQRVERALVLECDALPKGGLPSLLKDIEQLDARYELIFLCHTFLNGYEKTPSCQLAAGRNLHRTYRPFFSNAGYVISLRAIEKLLPDILTMRKQFDSTLKPAYLTGVATWAVLPRAIDLRKVSSLRDQKTELYIHPPNSSVMASLDNALYLFLGKAKWLFRLTHLGLRIYHKYRLCLYILRNRPQERKNSSRAVNNR